LLGVLACTGDWVTVDAAAPLDRIVLSPLGEAFVHAQPGVELDELVSTAPFREKNLRPGMTADEVAAVLGEPDYLGRERGGSDEVFGFHAESGDFEVIKQHVSSEGTEVDRWFVRYRPRDCAPLVDPRLLRQIESLDSFPSKVTVLAGSDGEDAASLRFDEQHSCSAIWWLSAAPQSS